MTSLQADFVNVASAEMAYEEIDFADRPGEDDIDIDIDLSAAPHDVDYIIEDIHSDAEQEAAMLNTDYLMIDDENASYSMDGVDIVQDESFDNLQMEDTEMRPLDYGVSDANANGYDNAELPAADFEAVLDNHHSESHDLDLSSKSAQDKNTLDHQARLGHVESISKARDVEDTKLPPRLSPSPPQLAADPYTSPSPARYESDTKREPGSIDIRGSNTDLPSEVSSGQHDTDNGLRLDDPMTILARHVVVMYRDTEYGLVSSSATDDPDTFFLKEAGIVNGPMGDLLTALREVVNDDLASDDELCLAIEDLGIEISETCSSISEMNLATIFDLYASLLHNDGVGDPVRLCVTLSTKVDFAKRLATLTAGFSEGKGLSELISWNETGHNEEGSQSLEDEEINQENKFIVEQDDGLIESIETAENALQYDATAEEHPSGDSTSDLISAKQLAIESAGEKATTQNAIETGSNDSSGLIGAGELQAGARQVSASATDSSSRSNDDVDEDGDLIDYEDEEYLGVKEASNSHSPFPAADHDDKVDLNYDQYDGPLERPITDPYGVDFTDQATADNTDRNLNDVSTEHVDDLREGRGYQHSADDTGPHEGEEYDARSIQSSGNKTDHESTLVLDDGLPIPAGLEPPAQTTNSGDDSLEDIDYNLDHPESTSLTNADIANIFSTTTGSPATAPRDELDEDEISYEEAEITESNESDQTLIAEDTTLDHEITATEQAHDDDEINYETDDQQDSTSPSLSKLTPNLSLASNESGNNKRSRGVTEDSFDQAPQQPKRVRS